MVNSQTVKDENGDRHQQTRKVECQILPVIYQNIQGEEEDRQTVGWPDNV